MNRYERDRRFTVWLMIAGVLLTGFFAILVRAQSIPPAALEYRDELEEAAWERFGPRAPVATLAAQLHQESGWRAHVQSPVGAQGLAEFMPATARWISEMYPRKLGPPDPFDAEWSIKAQSLYMGYLIDRNPGATECDTWAFALSAYNGGEGWLRRDRTLAGKTGKDTKRWFGQVEFSPDPRRATWAVKENRGYPSRILLLLTPRYVAATYGRGVPCRGTQ